MEIVFWGVTAALAALGLIELVRMLVFWLTRPLRPGALTLVLSIEEREECEQLIRAGLARLQWMDWGTCRLVCVNKRRDPGGGDLQSAGAALSPADPLQNPGFGVSYTAERSSGLAAMGEPIWKNRERPCWSFPAP